MEGDPLPATSYNHVAFDMPHDTYEDRLSRIRSLGLEVREGRASVADEGHFIYSYDDDSHLFELHSRSLASRLTRYTQS